MGGVGGSPADEDGNFNAGECSESHAWFQPAGTRVVSSIAPASLWTRHPKSSAPALTTPRPKGGRGNRGHYRHAVGPGVSGDEPLSPSLAPPHSYS